MQINIVTGPFLPCGGGPAGAVEKIWLGVAQCFVASGHEVNIISRAWAGLVNKEVISGVQIKRVPGASRSASIQKDLLKDLLYSLRVLAILPEADVTVTNTFWLPPFASLYKQKFGKIIVNIARWPKNQCWLYAGADRLSAVSRAVADEIINQSPRVANLVKVVPNPVDTDIFRPIAEQPPCNGRFRVLYTGRIHPEKGIHLLIQAVKQLLPEYPALELALVGHVKMEHGGGGASYLGDLRSAARGLPVRFEDPIIEPRSLALRMAKADYYCYPSLADTGESFGVAPLEAMALGYAPILSSLSCFCEFAEDGVNAFLFDHHHADPVEQLANAMRRAMRSSEKAREMGRRAFHVSQKFNYANISHLYLDDWNQVHKI